MIHVLKSLKGEPTLATVLAIIPVKAFAVLNNFLQSLAESTFKKNTHTNMAVFLSLSRFSGESSKSLKRGCS